METDSSQNVENDQNTIINSNSNMPENNSKTFKIPEISIYSILSGNILETNFCQKITDCLLFLYPHQEILLRKLDLDLFVILLIVYLFYFVVL